MAEGRLAKICIKLDVTNNNLGTKSLLYYDNWSPPLDNEHVTSCAAEPTDTLILEHKVMFVPSCGDSILISVLSNHMLAITVYITWF